MELGNATPAIELDALTTVLKLGNQNMSKLIQTLQTAFGAVGATATALGIVNSTAGGTQVALGSGYLIAVSVVIPSTASTLTGLVYDSNTLIGIGSSVAIGVIPQSNSLLGGPTTYNWPFANGLVVQPSSVAMTVSVSYTTGFATAGSS